MSVIGDFTTVVPTHGSQMNRQRLSGFRRLFRPSIRRVIQCDIAEVLRNIVPVCFPAPLLRRGVVLMQGWGDFVVWAFCVFIQPSRLCHQVVLFRDARRPASRNMVMPDGVFIVANHLK